MKKIFILLSILFVSLTSCANDKPITFEQLPHAAQTFVTTHFPTLPVSHIMYEREGLREEYKVYLKSGVEIEFGAQGSFESVDCKISPVPETIIPEPIQAYVKQYFPESFIVSYSVDSRHLDAELSNGVDLIFNHSYDFVRVDD